MDHEINTYRRLRDDHSVLRSVIKKQSNIPGLKGGGLLEIFDKLISEIDLNIPELASMPISNLLGDSSLM